jgi:hypothetical protein
MVGPAAQIALTGVEETPAEAPRLESRAASRGVVSLLAGRVDAGLDFSDRAFDEGHGPLAMAALVQRCRTVI